MYGGDTHDGLTTPVTFSTLSNSCSPGVASEAVWTHAGFAVDHSHLLPTPEGNFAALLSPEIAARAAKGSWPPEEPTRHASALAAERSPSN